ncbi:MULTISPECIES: AraC family transcriptional regulator [Blautia]|jgi:AraC-like DNA-binding protein/quercetin dioxygenase-like cupin family protein|uniref:AraC family transcriptional regulator n=1 Tax=Blautia TaxID=572511 RepID=UPI000E4A0D1A|nr:AraC family transcriptional regulator [Blautia sp.]RHO14363.1 AraC family transcriptional regulator [Ruminococcus sp. AM18-44]RHO22128.1 AraC family transcriptional regulator [Ruminococcus sp. AM18-15]RHQ32579.1 AraC family transcriptional regulator [Ruminococcus sp. AF25-28AC]RHS04003.1 AraC family transcriptional regulator [Ruminococcus sp. AF14-5]RHS59154.1 AraC family transcriptional regulator [Ruminococcus sp. AM45-9BH]RHS70283.1 AraC family transcriptional regulator [Ruminococcus sp.
MEFQHELIIPNEGLPFKVFLFEGGNGNYVREKHWHTSIEIFAVMEGHLEFFMNKEEYPLKAGEQLIINSNEIHSIHAAERNKTVVLQIPLKQFENYFTAQRFIRFRSQDAEADGKLASLIKKLYKVYTARDTGYEFGTMSLFYEIMYMLVKNYRLTEAHEKEIRHSRKLDTLSKITTYMREHYKEDLKLSDLAATFGYSDAYLSRMFQKYAKINYKTYLQDIRMAYAYRDLMNTDRTISQIALDNGFCSSRGFSGEFQKRYGILPSEMRKQENQKGQKNAIE